VESVSGYAPNLLPAHTTGWWFRRTSSPVSGEENNVRIVKEAGFIWKDGQIAQGRRMMVDPPEISFETSGRHAVISLFHYTSD
jgi:hypothetical protein